METTKMDISVYPLQEKDLSAADQIFRLAFGTFIGLPDPTAFGGDSAYIKTRWQANPAAAFGAQVNGKLVGSNFATNWGSVGFFGPLTIHPELWDRSVGKHLMQPIIECFEKWGTEHAGLFTFAQSQKHVGLYQKFGFWPQFLTAIMSKSVQQRENKSLHWTRFSALSESEQKELLLSGHQLTDSIYAGLDVSSEVRAVAAQKLGDTVLLWDDSRLVGLAVCHYGAGTEAGSGSCYIKFGAAGQSNKSAENFDLLLNACEEMAVEQGLTRIVAGVNTARHEAYRQMLAQGFRTQIQGVAMHRPNKAGYNRPGIYLIDDWR